MDNFLKKEKVESLGLPAAKESVVKSALYKQWALDMQVKYSNIDEEIMAAIGEIRDAKGRADTLIKFASMFMPKLQAVQLNITSEDKAPQALKPTDSQLINVINLAKGNKGNKGKKSE